MLKSDIGWFANTSLDTDPPHHQDTIGKTEIFQSNIQNPKSKHFCRLPMFVAMLIA